MTKRIEENSRMDNFQCQLMLLELLVANNLLNSRYERWYGYDAFGFNILGGARLKF